MPDLKALERLQSIGWIEVIHRETLGACWEWKGNRLDARGGYGRLRYDGKDRYAHRVSYQAHFGEIPSGLDVLHKCDNPPCVNPLHLFVGTRAENIYDMIAKGRSTSVGLKGKDHPNAKLTLERVLSIKQLIAEGIPTADIAKRYNMDYRAVWKIKRRKAWTHV